MKESIKLLIFDLDGTLIESHRDILTAVNRTLEHFKISSVSEEEIKKIIGSGVFNCIIQKLSEHGINDIDQAKQIYEIIYSECMLQKTFVYSGVFEMLDSLNPYKKVVLTNKSHDFVGPILKGLGLSEYFVNYYGKEAFEKHKPDPLPILKIAKEFGISSNEILIVGDSKADILAGKKANSHTVGVSYGYGELAQLQELQADFLICHPSELMEIIRH